MITRAAGPLDRRPGSAGGQPDHAGGLEESSRGRGQADDGTAGAAGAGYSIHRAAQQPEPHARRSAGNSGAVLVTARGETMDAVEAGWDVGSRLAGAG